MIPYGRQQISEADIQAVVDVLRSDFLTQGPCVPAFEQALATKVDAAHSVAFNSATSALHAACLALELKPGDHIWTSPVSFVASANCAYYCGAKADFVDIDPETLNLCPQKLRLKLEQAEATQSLPRILIPVHFAGQPCEMAEIHRLARAYDIKIIEDASHAVGAQYRNQPVGNCQYSDITIFSFHPVKIMTTGEGGMATTQQAGLAQKMQSLRSHGITRDPAQMTEACHGPWYYQQLTLGFNYRMTDIQAALGLSQLTQLDTWIQQRNQLALMYDQHLAELPIKGPFIRPENLSSWHLYVIQLKDAQKRSFVFEKLREQGIGVNVHYIPIHLQPFYQAQGFRAGDFPVAEDYYHRAITLPLYPGLGSENLARIVEKLDNLLKN